MVTRRRVVRPLTGTGPQSTWGGDQLGSQNSLAMTSVATGGYIRRVRVQGCFTILVIDTNPSVTEMRNETPGAMNITWGVWFDKTGVNIPSQTPPQNGDLDEQWVYWNEMTLQGVDTFHSQSPDDRWFATWTLPYNDNDSTSARGPSITAADVILSWGFVSPGYNPLTDVVTDLGAFYNYALTWEFFIEEP